MEYLAFMAAIPHSEQKYVVDTLKEYNIGAYLIGMEITKDAHKETNGHHFHFLVQMSNEDYHKYSKRVFVDRYKLRGKALKDKPRQYGRVKKIEDLERMAAYTLKQSNIITNMTEEQLESYKKISFKVKEKNDFREDLMEYLANYFGKSNQQPFFRNVAVKIIDYYRYELKEALDNITKARIETLARYYQIHYCKNDNSHYVSSEDIISQMFPFS